MTKKEIKKRIGEGFAELAPDISEAVIKSAEEQGLVFSLEHPREEKGFFGKMAQGRRFRYASAICALLALACFSIFARAGAGHDAASLVVDINPSIRVGMDASGNIRNLKGLDGDGRDVVEHMEWEKGEPVAVLLEDLVESAAGRFYLKEDGGILVTLFAPDEEKYEELEDIVECEVTKKLKELNLSGVMVALQRSEGNLDTEGRKILEEELVRACGLTAEEASRMPVAELIRRCKDNAALGLKVSDQPEEDEEADKKREDGEKEQEKADNGQNTRDPNHPMERKKQEELTETIRQEKETETEREEASGAAFSETPAKPSAEAPAQAPAETPAEVPVQTPVGTPAQAPAEPPAETPAQAPETPAVPAPSDEKKSEKKEKKKKDKGKKKKAQGEKEKKNQDKEKEEKKQNKKKQEEEKREKEKQEKAEQEKEKQGGGKEKREEETDTTEKKQKGKKEVLVISDSSDV